MEVSKLKAFVEGTSKRLFEAEHRRLDKIVEALDRQNREIKGYQVEGFLFQGKLYIPGSARFTNARGVSRQSLSFTLQDKGNEMLTDYNAIAHDQKIIEQFLYKTLYNCMDWQDIRDTVPECLVEFWPELHKMPRIHERAWLAPKDERYRREAEKLLPKIQFYSVTYLMY